MGSSYYTLCCVVTCEDIATHCVVHWIATQVRMSGNLNDAAMAGNVEEVLIRLNMGEDVNQKCYPRYSTPLHDAVCCGRQEVVEILVTRGANVNELDYKNMTPLKLAVRYGQEDIEALLRAKGAKEAVDVPKKVSVVGEDPPWVRKTSRREHATA